MKTTNKPTYYRHLDADLARRHHNKPCDNCGRPIGYESYSWHDRTNPESAYKFCTKRCSLDYTDKTGI